MSESLSSPWIRDYLLGIADTYGAKLFNAPVSTAKKKVQLTDFLTYQEDSYVWAWMSDKDYRVSVRISKDAVNQFESTHGRKIIDSRFSVIFVSNYRPMFSPRPLGPNTTGNTPVSHISLEISHVKSLSIGSHLFGNPRDLESDQNMKEWVLGLRQDGGGGNVLKLRKQQELVQNKKPPVSPPSPPPFSLYAPVSPCRASKTAENIAKPKFDDRKRAYAKIWRMIETDRWKLAVKPTAKESEPESSRPPVQQKSDTPTHLGSPDGAPSLCPASPHRTPSPNIRPQQQGTPTDWSPSNRGSPTVRDELSVVTSENMPEVTLSPLRLPSGADGHTTAAAATTPSAGSLQPPTPAQRIKCIASPRSSPPRSSPAVFACFSSPSQQLPRSSPPPLSSSLPLPSSSLPVPTNIRKNIQRKVPHPGLPTHYLEPTKQGPAKILVPNSDTSGTGSSQPQSQSQQCHPRPLSCSPIFPPSIAKDSKPPDSPTSREADSAIRLSSDTLPICRIENEGQETARFAHIPRHDSEAWKEPSFVARSRKALAVKEAGTSSVEVGKKRRLSAQPESPVPKRIKVQVATKEVHRATPDQITRRCIQQRGEAPTDGTIYSNHRPSAPPETTETIALQLPKPRLANLAIGFARIDLGKRVLIPMVYLNKDIRSTLLRTGRIRTLGKEVEENGKIYIMR